MTQIAEHGSPDAYMENSFAERPRLELRHARRRRSLPADRCACVQAAEAQFVRASVNTDWVAEVLPVDCRLAALRVNLSSEDTV